MAPMLSLLFLASLCSGNGLIASSRAGEILPAPQDEPKPGRFDFVTRDDAVLSQWPFLYRNDENPVVQSLQLTGLYNGQWYSASGEGGLDDDDWEHRAFWLGAKLRLFEDATFRARFDVRTPDQFGDGRVIESLEDTSLVWKANDDFTLRLGKFKPRVTREFVTPRQALISFERSLLVNQVRPDKVGGAQVAGTFGDYDIRAGVFSGALTGDWDLPDFSGGLGGALSVARALTDHTGLRLDYFYNDGNSGNNGFADYGHLVSLNSSSHWDRLGVVTDLIGATGIDGAGDVAGVVLMPWYDLTDKLKLVSRYQLSASNSNDGIRLQRRYERTVATPEAERGDLYHAAYLGLNYQINGDKLKLMSGLEYSHLDGAVEIDAWTFFAGVRLYF